MFKQNLRLTRGEITNIKINQFKLYSFFLCTIFIIIILSNEISAALSGFINQDTTFTIANSPYSIDGDVFISDGVTVTIDPGVTFQFKANSDLMQGGDYSDKSEIIIYGTLVAEGKSDSIITLKSYFGSNVAGEWGQIKTDLQGKLFIQYASVKCSKYGIHIYGSAPMEMRIDNCDFQNIEIDAVRIISSNITKSYISANTFTSVGRAVYSSQNYNYCSYNSITNSTNGIQVAGYSTVESNNFSTLSGWGCSVGGSSNIIGNTFQDISGDGIDAIGNSSNCISNSIINSNGFAIDIYNSDNIKIYGNFINGNANDGIRFYNNADGNIIKNNVIINKINGINFYQNCNNNIYYNTIFSNSSGIYINQANEIVSANNIITNNSSYGIRTDYSGQMSSDYDNVWNNGTNYYHVSAGNHDISVNPYFTNLDINDFTLQVGSPCLVMGENGGQMGAYGGLRQCNHSPNFEFINLNNSEEIIKTDNSIEIKWFATDPDTDGVYIYLFWDTDTDTSKMVAIDLNLENTGFYIWDTSRMIPGIYYIYGVAYDYKLGRTSRYGDIKIQIYHDTIPITIPKGLSAFAGYDTVQLKWNKNSESDLLGYNIYRSTNNISFDMIDNVYGFPADTFYIDTSIVNKGYYWYKITAVDTNKNESKYSNTVNARPGDFTTPIIEIITPDSGFSIPEHEPLTVSWTATDNIAMDSVHIIYTKQPGGYLYFMGKVPADSSQFTFDVPAGITDQAAIYLHGWDKAGNDTLVNSPYFSVTDNTPPDSVVITNLDICSAGHGKAIEWISGDNSGSFRLHYIYASINDEPFSLIGSVGGDIFRYIWQVPNIVSDSCRIKIESFDLVDLSAADTSDYFSIIDDTRPQVEVLTPQEGFSIPEYEDVTVTWEATDNVQLGSFAIYYSNDGGHSGRLVGSVSPDTNYYTFQIPSGVTDSATIQVKAKDSSFNTGYDFSPLFSVTDNTPPEVALLTQLQGSEFAIGSMIQIEWIATDNVEVTTIDLLYSTDLSSGWKVISIGEENDGEYQWLIPNDPSDQCRLKIVAHDAVGLSSESLSGNPFSIVIEYPYLVSSSSIISQRDSICLHFNQTIDTDKFSDGISINSSVIENPEVLYRFDNYNRSVALYCENTFVSADTLTIVLTADQVTNIFGYGLDGNHSSTFEGAPVDNDTVEVIVRYSADFDDNDQINWDDLVILSDAWYIRDYRYELGPVIGNPPHFQIASDSLFNIEDAMTFGRMWNWQASLGKRVITMPQTFVGSDIITEQIGNIIIVHSSPVSGKRVVVQYNSDLVSVDRNDTQLLKPSEMTFNLYAECPDSERVEFVSYSFDQNPVDDPVSFILNSQERYPIDVKIGFEGINADGELVQSSVSIVQFQPVPDKYELYPNYPNPFNSSTIIEYAIPEKSNVSVEIYDLRGYKVRNLVDSPHEAHYYRRLWDARDDNGRLVASGLYFMRIVAVGETRTFTKTKKMVMIR